MGIYDDLSKLDSESPTLKVAKKPKVQKMLVSRKKKSPVNQSIDQSTNRPVNRSTDQSTDQLSKVDTLGPIVDRPRAFYITQKVDHWLDVGVRHLREKGIYKMDRSVLVNALIHNPDLYKSVALKKIRKRLLAHLTNKSLKRAQSTD